MRSLPDLQKVRAPMDCWTFDTRHIGQRVHVQGRVTSTFDLAADLAADAANAGTIVVADVQTAGRGQHGRVWRDQPGCSLLATILLFPPPAILRPVILTAWAAVAVAETIYALTGVQAAIKWPNDLLVRGRKVCGILIEQRGGTLVGIGLNLNQTAEDFAAAGLPDATSLMMISTSEVDRRTALSVLVQKLDAEYERLLVTGPTLLESDWKWRLGLLGRHISADLTDETTASGRLREMGFDGLELETGDGAFRVLRPETVRHIRAT